MGSHLYLSSWVACEQCERSEKNPVAAVKSRRLTFGCVWCPVQGVRGMSAWCRREVAAALSLILSAGAARSYATPVTVVGGNSTTVGGWQISPDPGITLNVTGVNSN